MDKGNDTIKNSNYLNIGIVTSWVSHTSINFLLNLEEVLFPISNCLHIVVGYSENIFCGKNFEGAHLHKIAHKKSKNTFSRIINYIILEIKISYKILKLKNKVELWIFFKGSESLLIPVLTAKLLLMQTKMLMTLAGSAPEVVFEESMPEIAFEGKAPAVSFAGRDGVAA